MHMKVGIDVACGCGIRNGLKNLEQRIKQLNSNMGIGDPLSVGSWQDYWWRSLENCKEEIEKGERKLDICEKGCVYYNSLVDELERCPYLIVKQKEVAK